MKKAFSLIEVLVSIILISILVYFSVQAFYHLKNINSVSNIRYLALDKIDSEMSRIVFAYENIDKNDFLLYPTLNFNLLSIITAPLTNFTVKTIVPSSNNTTGYNVYKTNPLNNPYGLLIANDKNNIIEIKNGPNSTNIINSVQEGDIVGLLGFRTTEYTTVIDSITRKSVDISLEIMYPYILESNGVDGFNYVQLWDFVETISLKTTGNRL